MSERTEAADGDGGPERPEATSGHHHRVRNGAIVLLGVVVVAVGVFVGAYLLRSTPDARSVDDAVEEFRKQTTVAPDASFSQPDPGVYEAVGSGEESISVPPATQVDGDTMPITVRLLPEGCWRWRIDYNSAHWHEYEFCPEGTGLIMASQRNSTSWDLGVQTLTNLSITECDPPAPILVAGSEPGDEVQHRCVSSNSATGGESPVVGPSTMVGEETLTIGGEEVATIHQRRTTTMSGAQSGDLLEDWWLERETGLPVRVERSYEITTDSAVGEIVYREDGEWQLRSMTPST